MQYTAAPVSTLFVKVRVRKSPYSHKTVALRISAAYHPKFNHNAVVFMRELSPYCKLQQLNTVLAQLQAEANAKSMEVDIAKSLQKRFQGEG